MSRLPASRPVGVRVASFRDAWSLLRVGVGMLVLALWRFLPWRWLVLTLFGLLLLEVGVLTALLGDALPLLLLVLFVVLVTVSTIVLIALHTTWRLLDPNRLVLLAPDGGAVLDVIFQSRQRVALANHGRAITATSAPALRRAVAEWVMGLEGYHLDLRAQNRAVADHYIRQFPVLERVGTDAMGHTRLALKS